MPLARRTFLVSLGGALLAACTAPEDVPPERIPSFDPALVRPASLALVLGGGGPRGFAHVGVIKVLEEAGVKPDLIVGASVGAMVGALYAGGMSAAELEREANELDVVSFFELAMIGGGLASGGRTQEWVNERVRGLPMQDLRTSLVVTAERMRDRKLVLFNRGDTGLAVRASSATPEMFKPVRIGDETYKDGDDLSPVPIHVARSLGARIVIAVDVSAYPESTPPEAKREWVEKDARRHAQVAKEAPEADVLLHPDIGYYAGHSKEYRLRVISAAERYTREKLPAIKAALAGKGVQSSTERSPAGVASR